MDGAEATTKLDVATWSDAFTGANQPRLDTNALNRLVYQLKLEPSLDKDVTVTLQETNNALKIYSGIDMSAADQNLSIVGDGAVWLQFKQTWAVSTGTTLNVSSMLNMKSDELTIESHGTTVVSGLITNGGTFVKTGSGLLSLEGAYTEPYTVVVEDGVIALGDPSAIAPVHGVSNLALNAGIQIDIDPAAAPNCDQIHVAGTLSGNGSGSIHISNIGGSSFTTGQIFQVFNQPFPDGATMAISPAVPAPGFVWANRLAIDGSIAVVAAPATTAAPMRAPRATRSNTR